jgi:hypothetical protein
MNQIDPMASKYSSLTPYNYSFNDPVTFTDVNGADPTTVNYSASNSQYYTMYTYDDRIDYHWEAVGYNCGSCWRSGNSAAMAIYGSATGYGNNFGNMGSSWHPGDGRSYWSAAESISRDGRSVSEGTMSRGEFINKFGYELWVRGMDYTDPNDGSVAFNPQEFFLKPIYGIEHTNSGETTSTSTYRWFDYTSETRAAIVTNIPFIIMVTQKGQSRPAQTTILVTVMIQLPKTYAISSSDFEKREWMNPNEASRLTDISIRTAHLETVMSIRTTNFVGLEPLYTRTFTRYLESQLSMRFPGLDLPGVPGARVISRQNIPSQYMIYATPFVR